MSKRPVSIKLVKETRRVHECLHCGFKGYWGPSWSWTLNVIGHGYEGYERTIKACSDECARALGMQDGVDHHE
jgi:hypothetical protein